MSDPTKPLHVVCVGASAGGLKPIEDFFAATSPHTGAAFVVVQHLSPNFKSLMDELLGRQTRMPIHRAEDGQVLERDTIYLIPPGKGLTVNDMTFNVEDRDLGSDHAPFLPINDFLHSLADDIGDRAIAVILSGSGSDGASGARLVAESGGLVFVQSPETAQFDGMLLSAIATNSADAVLPPDELAAAVNAYLLNRMAPAPGAADRAHEEAYARILEILHEHERIDFHQYKSGTLLRRIEGRCQLLGFSGLDAYADRLKDSATERETLRSAMLIGVTKFFRDTESWTTLATEALPEVVRRLPADEPLRIWSVGCSTGEEAISLAIVANALLAEEGRGRDFKIFATDLDPQAIEFASAGRYPLSIEDEMDAGRLASAFVHQGDHYELRREVRHRIVYARHDVTRDTPFTRIHLVVCRNLLIYLLPGRQSHVLRLLHFALAPHGLLFLGAAEGLGDLSSVMGIVSGRARIFSKEPGRVLPRQTRTDWPLRWQSRGRSAASEPAQMVPSATGGMRDELVRTLLQGRGACAFFVGLDGRLIESFGAVGDVVRVPSGPYTSELAQMLFDELTLPVATAMHRSRRQGRTVRFNGIEGAPRSDGSRPRWSLETSFRPATSSHVGFHVVVLEPDEDAIVPRPDEDFDVAEAAGRRVHQLETELAHTRESLQTTVEELETTNEEQQATNEELLAANEELQSTNEELHSVNEELYTVNAEHQVKIQQLTELTDDFDNMLQSTDLGVLFLDGDLRVRRFTPAITRIFNLQTTDIGRVLSDLTHRLVEVDPVETARTVGEHREPIQREVRTVDGRDLLLRWNPYRVGDLAHEGVVITAVDIAPLKAIEQALEQSEGRFRELAEHVQEVFWIVSPGARELHYISPGYARIWGLAPPPPGPIDGLPPWLSAVVDEDRDDIGRLFAASASLGRYDARYRIRRPDGETRVIRDRAFPVMDPDGTLVRIVGIAEDVTKFEHALEEAREAAERYAVLVRTLPDVVYERRAGSDRIRWRVQPASDGTPGLPDDLTAWYASVDASHRTQLRAAYAGVERDAATRQVRYRVTLGGAERWFDERVAAYVDGEGRVALIVGVLRDVSAAVAADVERDRRRLIADLALGGAGMRAWRWRAGDEAIHIVHDGASATPGMVAPEGPFHAPIPADFDFDALILARWAVAGRGAGRDS